MPHCIDKWTINPFKRSFCPWVGFAVTKGKKMDRQKAFMGLIALGCTIVLAVGGLLAFLAFSGFAALTPNKQAKSKNAPMSTGSKNAPMSAGSKNAPMSTGSKKERNKPYEAGMVADLAEGPGIGTIEGKVIAIGTTTIQQSTSWHVPPRRGVVTLESDGDKFVCVLNDGFPHYLSVGKSCTIFGTRSEAVKANGMYLCIDCMVLSMEGAIDQPMTPYLGGGPEGPQKGFD